MPHACWCPVAGVQLMYRFLLLTAQTQRPTQWRPGGYVLIAIHLRMYMPMHWLENELRRSSSLPNTSPHLDPKQDRAQSAAMPSQQHSLSNSRADSFRLSLQQNHILMHNQRVVCSIKSDIWSRQKSLHVASTVVTTVKLEGPDSYGQKRYHLSTSLWQQLYQVTVLAYT